MRNSSGSQWKINIAVLGLLLAVTQGAAAQGFEFVEVGAERGLLPYVSLNGIGGGIAVSDYDDDGDIDFFVPNALGTPDQLYRNSGDGSFEEIAAAVGLAVTARSRNALWFDYDGDRKLDLLVGSDCWDGPCMAGQSLLRLYRQNNGGTFDEVTVAAGLFEDGGDQLPSALRGGMSVGDINNDGFLDFTASFWEGLAVLYLNQGNGTFTNISASSGIEGPKAGNYQTVMHDFNRDGWLDIYVIVDDVLSPVPNRLWINQTDNTFVDMAAQAGADIFSNEMGCALGDYDNDGDLDVYMTNIFFDVQGFSQWNSLLRNDTVDGVMQFTELAQQAGVDETGLGWGTAFFDADKDGWLDLAATNGLSSGEFADDPTRFFLNLGNNPVSFADRSSEVGIDDTFWGVGLIPFDADRDGDLDLIQTTNDNLLRFLDHRPEALAPPEHGPAGANNYLVVKPRMTGPNYRAIGAIVRVEVGATQMMRLIKAGSSFMSQEPAESFFGVATTNIIDQVSVEWPDGTESKIGGVSANQVKTIESSTIFADSFESGNTDAW